MIETPSTLDNSKILASLLLMGFATAAIGMLPTYNSIGIAAPILLFLGEHRLRREAAAPVAAKAAPARSVTAPPR